jgi:hypothetical protein
VTLEAGGQANWAELAARLSAAAQRAREAARMPPVAGAAVLLEPLSAVAASLAEAERLCRRGDREGIERFRRQLGQWVEELPVLRGWMDASSALVAGWAAAAGISPGYGPGGARTPEAGPGRVMERG